ncbi:MAG: FAD-dependent oxidoreductase [Steroidobacteraceae bacterium]|nr:FAD-dependent oxidoreductase [Steroidobacteraceae bacterium]
MRVAVVGAGVAGLHAAWRLAREHEVTLYEAADYPGGHTATVDVEWQGRTYGVDTGFIVFNDWTYPNFIAMLHELGVAWQPSNMSFSLQCERTGLEYNGTSLNSLFAQRRNALRPSFLRMIADILRFNARSRALASSLDPALTLGEYLANGRYSRQFVEHYIVPMGRAIWSAEASTLLGFPARFFVEFFDRHGFLSVDQRPVWQAVKGGSREYVRALLGVARFDLKLSTPVASIRRLPNEVRVRTARGDVAAYDHVFLACHAPQALAMLEQPSPAEAEVLRAFPYAANEVILHTDDTVLPRRPLARAAWNYHLLADAQEPVALTYDMNVLQSLDAPVRFLVSLNLRKAIDERKVLRTFSYDHPVYSPRAVAAQARQRELDGANRTYYCGAYWRSGFHEDGVVSAQAALAHFVEDLARADLPLRRVG